MPQSFAAHFANGDAFFPHQTLVAPTAAGNVVFPWGVPTVQSPPVDAANPEDNQGKIPTETPDNEDEYRGLCLHFQVSAQASQPANMNQFQAALFGYAGETSMPVLTYAPNNLVLQYMQTGVPQAPNAQTGGQFPRMVHVAQIVPLGFSYPPQMLFASQSAHAQEIAPETSRSASQVAIPIANLARPTYYQSLDDKIRVIEGFFVFGINAQDLCLVPNVVLP